MSDTLIFTHSMLFCLCTDTDQEFSFKKTVRIL